MSPPHSQTRRVKQGCENPHDLIRSDALLAHWQACLILIESRARLQTCSTTLFLIAEFCIPADAWLNVLANFVNTVVISMTQVLSGRGNVRAITCF